MGIPLSALLCAVVSPVFAQPTVPIRQRAIDRVVVKDGPWLYGAITNRAPNGNVTIAVRREWLKADSPKFFEAESQAENNNAGSVLTTLRDRIIAWRKERAGKKDLLFLLDRELKRVDAAITARKAAKKPQLPEFMLITLARKRIQSGFQQPTRQKLIALYAWKERLKDPESRKATDLLAELRKRRVDLSSPTVDLADRLPPTPENETAWTARKAIVEYDALKRLRFQGTSDYLVEAGGDALKRPDITKIFNGMLNGQVNKLLADALAEALGNAKAGMKKKNDSFAKAVKAAEKADVRGFRITRVDPDLLTKRVTVEEQFIAKLPNGKWQPVWTFKSTTDASKKRPDAEKRIANDQQVKKALQTVKALGLAAGNDVVETAIRFGAATMEAQQKAEEEFHKFRERYINRLDKPSFRSTN